MEDQSNIPSIESYNTMQLVIAYKIAEFAMSLPLNPEITPESCAEQFSHIFNDTFNMIINRKNEK